MTMTQGIAGVWRRS